MYRPVGVLCFALLLTVGACSDSADDCQELPADIPQDTTLVGCYHVSQTPVLGAGVTMTLQPGVVMRFAAGTALEFVQGQTMVASGTAAQPILLTGDVAQRGFWKGLRFDSTDDVSGRLEYVTVEYAGSTTADNDPDSAAVKLTSDSRPVRMQFSHVTLRESQGWGLWLTNSAEMSTFTANTFTANTLGPISVDSSAAGQLDATSSYQGNDVDLVLVRSNRLDKNPSWDALDVPYLIDGTMHVDVPWVLAPGTRLRMGAGATIWVMGDAAAFNAVGTAAAPIEISGLDPTKGSWDAIIFDTSNNAQNALDYVTVSHGGGGLEQNDLAAIVATSDSHGVTLSVTNSTIEHSQRHGIWLCVDASANADIDTSNTFTDNTSGDVYRELP